MLIASPQMRDAFFERAVVLLWHHDEDGAVGVIVNRDLTQHLPDVISAPPDVDLTPYATTTVCWGGPVEPTSGTMVTNASLDEEDGWALDGGINVSRSLEQLVAVLKQGAPVLLCLGYAGWGPGQLDDEVSKGSWLWIDADANLIFGVPAEQRYDRALATLGLTTTSVWMQPIDE